jgi:HemY protein
MRAVAWLMLMATAAVAVALAARYNEGYVLFVLPPWRAELSLNFLLLLLLAGFILAHGFLSTLRHAVNLPHSVAEFRRRRILEKASVDLRDATRLMIEGRYGHAIRCAESAYLNHPESGMVALAGWHAAHGLRDPERVKVWRQRAYACGPSIEQARLMTEAELALEERRFDDAREALEKLAAGGRRHLAAVRLLLRAEQGLGHWAAVARLVKQLEKYRAMTPEQAAPIRRRAVREALRGMAGDPPALQRYWRELDDTDRADPSLALETARALAASGDCREAQRAIEDTLEEHWDESLILAYADCHGGDVLGRIARAEAWLTRHPRDSVLLLTLGRLCREQRLWGKAQSFLEASLAIQPARAAHIELAQLLESFTDQPEKSTLAARHYRAAALIEYRAN